MAEGAAHRLIDTNGIKMHIAEMGSGGPTVVLLHGFPETWYTWRFQLKALADAGFHAVAPDLRGFGTECPRDSSGNFKLTPLDLVGDIVGLIYALGGDPVFVVGHDIGTSTGWNLCRMRPDLVRAYASLGGPFVRAGGAPTFGFPQEEGFYVNRFGVPGRAEKDFARFDTATVLKNIYTLFCRSELQIAGPDEEIMDLVTTSDPIPSWLTEEFIKVQSELYDKSGFECPLRFTYRDRMRKFELMAPWISMPVTSRCLYITGKDDYVRKFPGLDEYVTGGGMKRDVPNLVDVAIVPGGHFVEEDSPKEVNSLLIRFFKE
ncbi:hypothetical protein SELMODRAFT_100032 [Selaginella moellendorffii]|uniref:AB hydrolase-1 domain-containing protein n=1 Tax=Selaginella moellendorffii TaxID=88036 RepID=D8RRT9_SELML|nr:uncharacterized protein LOC9642865 [Selaginella moellendorffii]EFJ24944.1 hypothetical protein SELMODRAFT_100032 [Selaginella moellendorffii]|eukprot:XP_002973989.1 uncharacterized protein LOC9642865 [Selaginella moellendorffii]